ncbi:MAG: DUF4149 domain-containing protein [Mariprofundaceae bacterium]|nr:DUF4149 domain-containing protein [Mariprofundaceae bacterium]
MANTTTGERHEKSLGIILLLMLASMVTSGYIVTPLLFYYANSPSEAGVFAGIVFQTCNAVVLLLGLAAIDAFWKLGAYKKRIWLPLLLILDLIALNGFVFTPIIADIKAAAGPIELLPSDDPQRQAFGMWHGITAVVHGAISVCCAWLVFYHYSSRQRE